MGAWAADKPGQSKASDTALATARTVDFVEYREGRIIFDMENITSSGTDCWFDDDHPQTGSSGSD
jgi:hypothetical protein